METNSNKLCKRAGLLILTVISPLFSFADSFTVNEQTQGGKTSLYAEIAIGIVFVGAVVTFLVWKAKHDKKEREKQMEKMKKIQAARRRAA